MGGDGAIEVLHARKCQAKPIMAHYVGGPERCAFLKAIFGFVISVRAHQQAGLVERQGADWGNVAIASS